MRVQTTVRRSAATALALTLLALALPSSPVRASDIVLHAVAPQTVTTLLFHQVSDEPIRSAHGEDNVKEPWLTPAQFDGLLSALETRGYTVVSLETSLAALGVRTSSDARSAERPALPSKPLLLTFDDGYASALSFATPILRKHHATATMFFEGKLTGTKVGRLTVADLRTMQASGVWRLASHGWTGHGTLAISADGTKSPYWYANLMYLASERRLETLAEYEARIGDDLHRFRKTFEPVLGRLDVFAYPSGEFGRNGALAVGGNALTRLEAGHSNSRELEPIFARVLAREGIRAAFAVAVPGAVHAASVQDGPYEFPRIGVGARFDPAILDTIASDGIELPEIASDDTFADCLALSFANDEYLTASDRRPEFFRLSRDGRLRDAFAIPRLLDDRAGQPTLVSALIVHGNALEIFQQAGWWPGATPYLTHAHLTNERATVDRRETLPSNLNWTVGAIERDGKLLAMTDEGHFYDVADAGGAPLYSVALATGDRHARFTGPAIVRGRTFVYDRILALLEEIDARGAVLGTTAIGGDIRALASRADELLAIDWSAKRRIVRRFRLADG